MRGLSNVPRGRDLWGWPPLIAALAVAAALLALSASRIVIRSRDIQLEESALRQKIERLEAEKARLEETIRRLGSDEAIERLAKEKLNLKNPGEEVAVVLPDSAAEAASQELGAGFSRFLPAWLSQLFDFLFR